FALAIQSQDTAAALSLRGWVGKALRLYAPQARAWSDQAEMDRAVALLTPEAVEDRLTLKLDAQAQEGRPLLTALGSSLAEAARRNRSAERLKQIACALQNYHDVCGQFPAVGNFKDGKALLSWRVHILPYLGEEKLYREFHLDEPWDSDHNKALIARMPPIYGGGSPFS